ncbi:hypothetical protein FQN54_006847 [Arachnomyces sp. PD_36]|nr:hypothetical protein FQN54_006847 [Arachnomyces sp. PD_36]
MSSNSSSFNLPGLGNLDKDGQNGTFTNDNDTNMGVEGRANVEGGTGGAFGFKMPSSQNTTATRCSGSSFGQAPPGTSTSVSTPLLAPSTKGISAIGSGDARPAFGITAGAMDLAATSRLSGIGFSQFAKRVSEEKPNNDGTSSVGGEHSTSSSREPASTSSNSSPVDAHADNAQQFRASGGSYGGRAALFSSTASAEESFVTASPAMSQSSNMPWRERVTGSGIESPVSSPATGSRPSLGRSDRLSISMTMAPSTAMVRYESPAADARVNGYAPPTGPRQDISMGTDSFGSATPGDSKFGSLDVRSLTLEAAIFCFGVLATQAHLAPRFEFTYGGGGLWGIKLTYWGHTIVKKELAGSKRVAKADICRQALEALKPQYESWIMPDVPAKCPTSNAWNWPHVLEKYCTQTGIDSPVYTKYLTGNGYRFEVEISGISYFGMLKHYRSEVEAKNASAHIGLYSVMVNNTEDTPIFPGAAFAKAGFANIWDEHESLLPKKRALDEGISNFQNVATLNHSNSTSDVNNHQVPFGQDTVMEGAAVPLLGAESHPETKGKKPRKGRRSRRGSLGVLPPPEGLSDAPVTSDGGTSNGGSNNGKNKRPRGDSASNGNKPKIANPNPYIPHGPKATKESHPWLAQFAGSAAENRWNVPPRVLHWQTRNCASQKERVKVICGLLALQDPEYNLDLYNRGFGAIENFAAASFPSDPFLARAGYIGLIRYTHGERDQAGEECAREVAKYLINMVHEDMEGDGPVPDVHIKTEPGM